MVDRGSWKYLKKILKTIARRLKMEDLIRKFNEVYGWLVEDGKPKPPKQDLPQAVKDRADYFLEMAKDGLTFLGVLECIFADEKPTDYDFGATKDWLPKSKEFDDWIGDSLNMSQFVIAVYSKDTLL